MFRALLLVSALAAPVAAAGDAPLPLVPIQAAELAIAGSLSNAWADFDNDGDVDMAVSLKSGEIRLLRNDGGRFVDVGAAAGLARAGAREVRGLSWGDYDGDGRVDLFAGSSIREGLSSLYRNTGGKFVDVAADVGLTVPNRSSRQNNWVDYDNDGDVDFYATDRAGKNRLFRNDGGKFVQLPDDQAPADPRPTVGACWFDFDRDGDLDLFTANQAGATDGLWRNDGGRFTDVAAQLGLDNPGRAKDEGGVGCAVGDYDNDGHLDLFVPNYGHNRLYRAMSDGTFESVGDKLGVGVENHAVGAAWGDYDNDGRIDLFVTSYEGPSGQQQPLNHLFHNTAAGFVDVLAKTSPVNAGDHGVQWVDYNRDGALDLSLTDGYSPVGGHPIFRNTLARADAARGFAVQVLDRNGRLTRAGAEVRVYDRAGKVLATRQVQTGEGYGAQSTSPLHFGLATKGPVRVEVTFMGKGGRRVQSAGTIDPARQPGRVVTVREQR